jgi:hypothetical protein
MIFRIPDFRVVILFYDAPDKMIFSYPAAPVNNLSDNKVEIEPNDHFLLNTPINHLVFPIETSRRDDWWVEIFH